VDDRGAWHGVGEVGEHDDPAAQIDGFFQVMRDEEDGVAEFTVDFLHEELKAFARFWIQSAEGFVHQQDLGFHGESLSDGDALPLPARKLSRVFVAMIRESHLFEIIGGLLAMGFLRFRREEWD